MKSLKDYVAIEGIKIESINFIFTALLALFVAMALKSMGALLINALLIIPAAAARTLGKTPLKVACFANGIRCISLLMGWYSCYF